MSETIGLILCGGFGKRLRPLTEKIPKPLVEIKENYTILDKQLNDFKNANVNDVYLLAGFLNEKIKERFGDEFKRIKLHYIIENEPLGTLNAIILGMNAIDNDKQCIIRNGDIVTDVNLAKMIKQGENSDYPFLMFITQMQSPYGIVEINGDRLSSFKEKPFLNYYINGGIYFSKETIDFGEFETGDIEKTILPIMAHKSKIGYYKEDGLFWMSIDTNKDLEAIKKEYVNKTDKPWGYEKLLIETDKYMTKELFIKEDYQTSFHYHEQKDETMYIISGAGYIEFEDKKEYFSKDDTIRIKPYKKHAIVASENVFLHEVSTPFFSDTIRVKDYYLR
jgi:NDP-sugar pyrophosphorylase family protein